MLRRTQTPLWSLVAAVAAPGVLTAVLDPFGSTSRDYVFLYLGVVAALGVATGVVAAIVAAATSFLLVDYYFVPPVHTFTVADSTDLVNLTVFFGAAGLVGGLGSRRRHAHLEAEALTRKLRVANDQLARLNREQADAAATAVRLAQTEQQVRVLEEGDRSRRELLANVSHELRTPLASLLTGTTALQARHDIPSSLHAELDTLADEARRLNRLVSDMLDMARIEGHALELRLEPVGLRDALEAAAARLRRLHPEREVLVELADDPEIVADWDRISQVLDNLLSNAQRFAPPGTPIELRGSPGKRALMVIRVIDHGPGVAPELRDRVFDRFVHEGSQGNGGTGLGLAIARGIVEAHAGRLWLEDSEPGEGARFAFSVPMAEAPIGV